MLNLIRWSGLRLHSVPARLTVALLAVAALGGCGLKASTSSRPGHAAGQPSSASSRATRTPAAQSTPDLATANGVVLHAVPHRIVSLSDAATEDLFAVGAGPQVVAVDQYSTYPRTAPRTRLSGTSPNVEAIVKYHPDLVVVSQNVGHIGTLLAALHIPMLYEPAPAGLTGAFAQLQQLGRAAGHATAAATLVASLKHRVTALVASVGRPSRPFRVYHELDQTHYSASSHTFIGQLYTLLGLHNIADSAAKASVYPQLSNEHVIAADPDLIVLADTVCCGQTAAKVATRPGWNGIAAVKRGAVLTVDDTVASEWGPRIVDFLAQVAAEVRKLEGRR